MSTITSVFDIIKTELQTALPNHSYLVNPYQPEENPSLYLNQGVGFGFGSGIDSGREICPKYFIRRDFFIVITRKFFASELNADDKETTVKDLFEDQHTMLQAMLTDIFGSVSQSVARCRFVGDNGIETVYGEQDNFLKLVTNFQLEYFETIT